MGKLVDLLLGTQSLARTYGGLSLSNPLASAFWSGRDPDTRTVDQGEAISLSGIFAGVDLLSKVVGMLPLHVYRLQDDGGKQPAKLHPAYKLLHTRPNPWMTAITFRKALEVCRLLWGYALAEIVWDFGGNAREIWPLAPWVWKPEINDGDELIFRNQQEQSKTLAAGDVLYIPNFTFDGVGGCSFIEFASRSLGLDLDAQEFASAFFANGAQPGGLLIHEGKTSPEQRKELRTGWEDKHQGTKKANRVGVLWGGWKYQRDAGSIEPEKAQLIDQRRFSIEEAARWLGIPPHMLRDLSRATFSNIEEQHIEAVVYTFTPITVSYEQEYDIKLLNPPSLFCKHNFGGLLRGNTQARTQFYKELFQIGGVSINEICELEDKNPIGPAGDLRFVPLNMQTVNQAFQDSEQKQDEPKPSPNNEGEDPSDPETPPGDPPNDHPGDPSPPLRAWLSDVLSRLANKEANALRRAARHPKRFLAWVEEFYVQHQAVLASALRPIGVAFPGIDADLLARAEVARSREDVLDLAGTVTPSGLAQNVESLIADWKATRLQATLSTI